MAIKIEYNIMRQYILSIPRGSINSEYMCEHLGDHGIEITNGMRIEQTVNDTIGICWVDYVINYESVVAKCAEIFATLDNYVSYPDEGFSDCSAVLFQYHKGGFSPMVTFNNLQ